MSTLEFNKSIEIESSVKKTWSIVGNLAKAEEWIPGIIKSEIRDKKRYCSTVDGYEIIEEFPYYSEKNFEFEYDQVKTPLPVLSSTGKMSVQEHYGKSMVYWKSTLEFPNDDIMTQVEQMINNAYDLALNNLREVVLKL